NKLHVYFRLNILHQRSSQPLRNCNCLSSGLRLEVRPTNTAKLTVNTPITWRGEAYRPIVLTGRDDRTVGESITNSPLTNYYADIALEINATNAVALPYLRIVNAKNGIVLTGSTNHVISHAQLVNCQ